MGSKGRVIDDTSIDGVFSAVQGAAPGAQFCAKAGVSNAQELSDRMILAGLVDVHIREDYVFGALPSYAEGHKVSVAEAAALLVDEDELLERDGLPTKKCPPKNSDELVNAAKAGRKPCKDCSCGLADMTNEKSAVDTKNAAKSNCGNCSLGDAFRCAGCPYLGLPPFKPGEKVNISKQLMTSDI